MADVTGEVAGWAGRVSWSAAVDGSVLALASELAPGLGGMPPPFRPRRHLLVQVWEKSERSVVLPAEEQHLALAQPYLDGFLLAAWRQHGRPNGVRVDFDGRVLDRIALGDALEDVRVSYDESIWCSYFDEGVYGHGVGQAGLVRYDAGGAITYRYNTGPRPTDFISDCYALDVAPDGDVWLCFYTDFPIVRLRDGARSLWKNGVTGARALAVDGERVILFGGYWEDRTGHIVELGADGVAASRETVLLTDERGVPFGGRSYARGVGRHLYVFDGPRAWRVDSW